MDGSTELLIDIPAIGETLKPLDMALQFLACSSAMITIAGGGDPDDMRETLDKAMVGGADILYALLTEIHAPDIETQELIGALEDWLP
jgi:hypothetical protein